MILRRGSSGREVADLQSQLRENGCDSGESDGEFGAVTEMAVKTFQRSHGLPTDGVAGAETLAMLAARQDLPTLAQVRSMFPFTPPAKIERHLPGILAALNARGLDAPRMRLVALATIRAEAEGFEPVEEMVGPGNTSPGGHAFDRYDHRLDLGNHGPPDGLTYRGRGFVQLTGRENYLRFGMLAGHSDLVYLPAQACDPDVAAAILAAFLSAHRTEIEAGLAAGDLRRVRRAVNGGTHGLSRFTDAYKTGAHLLNLE